MKMCSIAKTEQSNSYDSSLLKSLKKITIPFNDLTILIKICLKIVGKIQW